MAWKEEERKEEEARDQRINDSIQKISNRDIDREYGGPSFNDWRNMTEGGYYKEKREQMAYDIESRRNKQKKQ